MILKSYEIQMFQAGAWKINAIFDDEELALFEARRLVARQAHAGVRVVAEEYDQNTGEGRSKTIFRSSKADGENSRVLEQRKETRTKATAQRKVREARKTRVRAGRKVRRKKTQRRRQDARIFLILLVLISVALAVMIGLRHLEALL